MRDNIPKSVEVKPWETMSIDLGGPCTVTDQNCQ